MNPERYEDYIQPTVRILAWLRAGERGASSEALVSRAIGIPITQRPLAHAYPLDPDDLRRCADLLDACPEVRPFVDKMPGPVWRRLAKQWDALVALMRREASEKKGKCSQTYRKMKRAEAAGFGTPF